ncbi:transposase [bacterium]|nr:transposase [bacterium]
MTKRRRCYTKEFKTEAIHLVQYQVGNASEVARNFGIKQALDEIGVELAVPIERQYVGHD